MRKLTIFLTAGALLAGVLVFAVRFTPPVIAEATPLVQVQTEPGQRCVRLLYPKNTPKQVPAGTRCPRMYAKHKTKLFPNDPPTVSFGVAQVQGSALLMSQAADPDGDTLLYTWSITGGRIKGEGPTVTWDLA